MLDVDADEDEDAVRRASERDRATTL